jgi:RNA polymerase sigma factor (TIGR02999 family)
LIEYVPPLLAESAESRDHRVVNPDLERPIAELLRSAREGDPEVISLLFARVYDELRDLARRVRRGRATPTLNTTALVHEAYFKLLPTMGLALDDLNHFRSLVARAMRQVLVDAARTKAAEKRGGGLVHVTMTDAAGETPLRVLDVITLDSALRDLAALDPRRAQVVELRFFGGLDVEETAQAMGTSTATVKRDWRLARAWLAEAMSADA